MKPNRTNGFAVAIAVIFVLLGPSAAWSQDSDPDLAKQLSNPVSDLISFPLQFNFDCCFGPRDGERLYLNIQPVIPLTLNDEWNLIVRTILPLQSLHSPTFAQPTRSGLGDTVQSFFLSPKSTESGIIWGLGPVFLWPTGTDGFSSGKWGIGPTGVVLYQSHGWTVGALANHIWSYAGDSSSPEVNSTFLQPFVSYSFPDTTTITLNSESTYDWTNSTWNAPINLMVGRIFPIFHQPVNFQIGARYWIDTPNGDPDWGGRFAITFLFPK